jgi:hypothetical protein
VRVAVGVRYRPAALPAADAGVSQSRHGQGLRAGRAGAAGNAPVPALAGDRDAAGRGLAARGRAGAAAPQHAVDLGLYQGRPERAAPAGPPVAGSQSSGATAAPPATPAWPRSTRCSSTQPPGAPSTPP